MHPLAKQYEVLIFIPPNYQNINASPLNDWREEFSYEIAIIPLQFHRVDRFVALAIQVIWIERLNSREGLNISGIHQVLVGSIAVPTITTFQ